MNTVMDKHWNPKVGTLLSAIDDDSLEADDLLRLRRVIDGRLRDINSHAAWCETHYYDGELGHTCTSEHEDFEHGEGDGHEGGCVQIEGAPDDARPGLNVEIYTEVGALSLADGFTFEQAHIVHRLLTNVPVEAGVAFGKLLDRIAPDRDEVSFR